MDVDRRPHGLDRQSGRTVELFCSEQSLCDLWHPEQHRNASEETFISIKQLTRIRVTHIFP